MRRKSGIIAVAVGTGLLLAGAGLGGLSEEGQQRRRQEWTLAAANGETSEPGLTLLSFPRLGRTLLVADGDAAEDLLAGPARMTWSALPGAGGNCVIAGHRDTHFAILKEVRVGDSIVTVRAGVRTHYNVTDLTVAGARERRYYGATQGPTLTLVTCFPFHYLGRAPKRYIVRAELTPGGV
jgi:sortase A